MNLPNKLTVFRIILVFVMVVFSFLYIPGEFLGVPIVFWALDFIFILASTYSIMFNIPIIEMSYPSKYLIIFIFLSIIRDYIIWFIAFLNKWVFAVFTLFTFISGGITLCK